MRERIEALVDNLVSQGSVTPGSREEVSWSIRNLVQECVEGELNHIKWEVAYRMVDVSDLSQEKPSKSDKQQAGG